MSDVSIRATAVGKRYRLGAQQQRYKSLRDSITEGLRRTVSKVKTGRLRSRRNPEMLWALEDVNFSVGQGEVVGIIGRNGAGKSTLLKLLSRITDPTVGAIDLWGRVGSLLEVGTGFHPELTGRENIYLSGAILGMKRREMVRKFDEMVAFAEVEKFIDTSVKHYSSGMYLRLAFAVAAHLEPEILLVDEVLAVGDARFQKKCLEKMHEVGTQGRTVLFVSHSMQAITRLCPRAILLSDGHVVNDGPAADVVASYLNSGLGTGAAREWSDPSRAPGNDVVRLRAVRVRSEDGRITETTDIRDAVGVEMEYDVLTPGFALFPHFSVHTAQGAFAFVGNDQDPEWRSRPRPVGRFISTGWIPGNLLTEGLMLIGAAMRSISPSDILHFYERDAVSFQVVDVPNALTARGDYAGGIPGAVRPLLRWTTHYQPAAGDHRVLVESGAARG
jgi:lipopolysaccharide transport system ATP-binding protein